VIPTMGKTMGTSVGAQKGQGILGFSVRGGPLYSGKANATLAISVDPPELQLKPPGVESVFAMAFWAAGTRGDRVLGTLTR
jgi:hypothetical protein